MGQLAARGEQHVTNAWAQCPRQLKAGRETETNVQLLQAARIRTGVYRSASVTSRL